MRSAFSLIAFVTLLAGCHGNKPPGSPEITGPSEGLPGESLVFTVTATDPEGGDVAYKVSWGDTSSIEWTPFYAGGQGVRREHAYADTGTYVIQAMARDMEMQESDWCDGLTVNIRLLPPGRPDKPEGPAVCTTGVSYEYRFHAVHPQNESLLYQIDWGGGVQGWRGPVASDSWLRVNHSFDTAGTYPVSARAQDRHGLMTDWSDTLAVSVVEITGGPPVNCSLAAATDTTVRLWWNPPVEGEPGSYRVSFDAVGGGGSQVVADTTALEIEHDPNGLTGTYTIAAVFGATVYEDTLPLSTVPIHTGTVTIGELSGGNEPGCGWDRVLGAAASFPMSDTLYCDSVDFYCTDFATGSSGPTYFVASPDTAPADSGGSVSAGRWRNTPLALLASEQGPVPAAGDTAYRKAVALGSAPVCIGCLTADGYYCVVNVTQIRVPNECIRFHSWFQAVRGLRLVRH